MAEIATFGAGCFWGVEATFQRVPGVTDTAVGYSGGDMPNPTYKDVCTDKTGHAEAVAKKSRAALDASGKFKRPIATEITQASKFYPAEEYHQKYLQKRGVASCHF